MDDPWVIWIGSIVTLVVFSYLARDNRAYRILQHAALGITVGIGLIITWNQVLVPRWWNPMIAGFTDPATSRYKALWILAIIPGSLWYFQLSRKYFWVSMLTSGLFIGTAAGLAFKDQMLRIMPQIADSIRILNPFLGPEGFSWANLLICLNSLIVILGMLTTLLYFFFSIRADNKPWIQKPMRFGRIMIMIALGSMFGATVMTRMSYLLERTYFIHDKLIMDQIVKGIFGG
jgi:hypothetical protein